ncbi:hypothetical protein, variant [Aphanomyces invadans]|nr:hypothetical protein, variant [Aphanomyces invadans]ETV96432.1 hypothetical protein, variant [Aphanomyces invadans]|eukprot:XP_008874695.1 hypothetical protein, variant [Aphanomyces invadans]
MANASGVEWTVRSAEPDITIYKGAEVSANHGTYLYMSVMEVAATLDEVIELFQTQTMEQDKAFSARFGKQVLDTVKLYSILEPTPDTPSEMTGIFWRLYKSVLPAVVAKRDACLLQSHHAFNLNGRRGWVASSKSVNLSCCPELEHLGGFVRMINYGSGHVFLESETRPGYLEIRYVAHTNFRGASYDYMSDAVLKRRALISDRNMTKRCRNIQDIDMFLRENRLNRGHILEPNQLVPKSSRRHCYLCTVRFGLTNPKSNCVKCGQVVCSKCNRNWNITCADGKLRSMKACVRCSLGQMDVQRKSFYTSRPWSPTHLSEDATSMCSDEARELEMNRRSK